MAGKKGMHKRSSTSPTHAAAFRARLDTSVLAKALVEHGLGQREMVPSQVTAILGLLRKVIPDLSATQISGDPDNPIPPLVVIGSPSPQDDQD